jgi:hypothetical protein
MNAATRPRMPKMILPMATRYDQRDGARERHHI